MRSRVHTNYRKVHKKDLTKDSVHFSELVRSGTLYLYFVTCTYLFLGEILSFMVTAHSFIICGFLSDMTSDIIKDCGDIWNRLFDHRPFLSGEIKYFIKEFEETRNHREGEKLAQIEKWIVQIGQKEIPKAVNSSPELEKLNTLLGIAQQTTEIALEGDIEDKEFDRRIALALLPNKSLRESEWDNFSMFIEERRSAIDKKYTDKEIEFQEEHYNLVDKLSP